jgi:hypothetical protein
MDDILGIEELWKTIGAERVVGDKGYHEVNVGLEVPLFSMKWCDASIPSHSELFRNIMTYTLPPAGIL